jgi:outer membrane lipoprotein carrier protein
MVLTALVATLLAAAPITPAAAPAAQAPDPVARPAAAAVQPAQPEALALLKKVQAFYERTRDLECRFTQTYSYAGLGRKSVSTGTLLVKKPGMMRWDYATPARKTVAVTGSRLVQFEPEENQALVDDKFDATALSAAVTFLVGRGDLLKEFTPALGEGGALVLTPRAADPRVAQVTLTVGAEGEVTGTAVLDGGGNENRLAFEGLKRNPGLKDAAFEVALPADVRRLSMPGR